MQESASHFSEMKNIQRTIYTNVLHKLLQSNPEVWHPLQRKLSRISVRSSFATWIYEYYLEAGLASKDHHVYIFRSIIPLAAEVVIAHAYLFNQIQDRKHEVVREEQKQENIRQANLLATHFDKYILEHSELSPYEKRLISTCVNRMKSAIQRGQELTNDTTLNLVSNKRLTHLTIREEEITSFFSDQFLEQFLDQSQAQSNPDLHRALTSYFARCYLINADLFVQIAALIGDLLEVPKANKTRKAVISFSELYGFMLQVVNDNSDFFYERPTNYKLSSDVLSDIRNSTYTFPLILHLDAPENKNKLVKRLFFQRDQSSLYGKHNLVLKEVMETNALRESMRLGRSMAKSAKAIIDQGLRAGRRLAKLTDIGHKNRYYHHYFKAKDFYRKSSNQDQLYRCENHTYNSQKHDPTAYCPAVLITPSYKSNKTY